MVRLGMRWAFVLLLLGGACDSTSSEEPPSSPSPQPTPAPSASSTPLPTDAGKVHRTSDALRRCAETHGALSTIADALARLGALPQPAGGPCFIATLPRPLAVVATTGVTSAQPAAGRLSPRLFFLLPKLVISAVPAGDGSKMLEFGEWVTASRTIKGEIGLPVTAPLAPDAAFQRVLQGDDRTVCATCHRGEERHPSIPNAFVSEAYRPQPGTFVPVTELKALHETCTLADDPSERCAMLHAVFDFGDVTPGEFAPAVTTFF